jgi:hypothetical protein
MAVRHLTLGEFNHFPKVVQGCEHLAACAPLAYFLLLAVQRCSVYVDPEVTFFGWNIPHVYSLISVIISVNDYGRSPLD